MYHCLYKPKSPTNCTIPCLVFCTTIHVPNIYLPKMYQKHCTSKGSCTTMLQKHCTVPSHSKGTNKTCTILSKGFCTTMCQTLLALLTLASQLLRQVLAATTTSRCISSITKIQIKNTNTSHQLQRYK